jgi:histone deacetylase 11
MFRAGHTGRAVEPSRRGASARRLAVLGILAWSCVGAACIPTPAAKETKMSRPGAAIGGTVAIVYSMRYDIDLGGLERLHPFDIHKYSRIYQALVDGGLVRPKDVFVPVPVTPEQVALVHTPGFAESLKSPEIVAQYLEAPIIGYAPAAIVDAGVLSAFRWSTGGTIEAGRLALRYGIAVNIGGGYHHAMPDHGGGFNIYNDLAIAIRVLQRERLIGRACVVDVDVHQGNGTATVFEGDANVFTFSIQEEGIYPYPRATSTLDVDLPAGTGDEEYLAVLERNLGGVLDRARPDIVFIQGGCDTLAGDPLAHMKMTPEGIVRRDAMILDACRARGIPVAMTLGGGYSPNAWKAQFASIARTIRKYGGEVER